jgi:hypothetical protein
MAFTLFQQVSIPLESLMVPSLTGGHPLLCHDAPADGVCRQQCVPDSEHVSRNALESRVVIDLVLHHTDHDGCQPAQCMPAPTLGYQVLAFTVDSPNMTSPPKVAVFCIDRARRSALKEVSTRPIIFDTLNLFDILLFIYFSPHFIKYSVLFFSFYFF